MTDRLSPPRETRLSRRQALLGASAAALIVGLNPPDSSAAILLAAAKPTDMTGHVPAYNAPIGFGRQKTETTIDDPYDLIFA